MRIRYLTLLVFGLVGCGFVGAQDLSGRDSTIFLKEEVVITAQRMETNSSAVAEAVSDCHTGGDLSGYLP